MVYNLFPNYGNNKYISYISLGWELTFYQLSGLLQKRWMHHVKDWRFIISSFILPCIMLAFSMLLPIMTHDLNNPAIILSPSLYGPESVSFVK